MVVYPYELFKGLFKRITLMLFERGAVLTEIRGIIKEKNKIWIEFGFGF